MAINFKALHSDQLAACPFRKALDAARKEFEGAEWDEQIVSEEVNGPPFARVYTSRDLAESRRKLAAAAGGLAAAAAELACHHHGKARVPTSAEEQERVLALRRAVLVLRGQDDERHGPAADRIEALADEIEMDQPRGVAK